MRVVVEATLDVQPLLELLTRLCLVDHVDELIDPLFNRTVHLVVSSVAFVERHRRLTSRSHDVTMTRSGSSERAAALGARKNTACRLVGSRRFGRDLLG